ncbi:hypothetical protein F4820DRAFT_225016 [Hypoxylon rubiginosum]|uniref:Uncharacterized protein n=1 Tax=Hypoxylon rubiginosum TaxID=110542 RepID=A0ACB9Z720_9PEZI|nr:hypothetical protein F4820DRAFT_225016 [Hypoxylon rubiginosum]
MSRYEDDSYSRGRSGHHHHHHEHSPDYAYPADEYPISYEESRRLAEEGAAGPKLLTYPSSNLQVPDSHSRPRSLPPPVEYRRSSRGRRTEKGYDRYDDESDGSDEDRARTPVDKARKFVDNTFSNSTTGLGVGVLGALVGGLAAREAVDARTKHDGGHHRRDPDQLKRNQLIGTVVGAAVGALGANAVEKRLEVRRERDKVKQERWDRTYRPGVNNADVVEKREVVTRPRSSTGEGWKKDWDPWDQQRDHRERDYHRPRSHGREREVDLDARSWKNVEDWLYDDRNDSRPRSSGRRSAEGEYRY